MSINSSISNVRSLLLNPKEQAPSVDQLFTHLSAEFQHMFNELSNSGQPWTFNSITVSTAGNADHLVPVTPGRVLFVTALPSGNGFGPIALEFADLADVSSNFYPYSPLDYGLSRDFNERINFPFAAQIAFYRKDNDLWFRLAPFVGALQSVTITYSTGNWVDNLSLGNTAVLSEHHHLVHTRTAMDLLPAAEWKTDENFNQARRENLARSFIAAEQRYAQQFIIAKRSLTEDEVGVRPSFDDGWGAFL